MIFKSRRDFRNSSMKNGTPSVFSKIRFARLSAIFSVPRTWLAMVRLSRFESRLRVIWLW
jgi:hypothetical protein